jgi:hypothetical protein
MTMRDDPIVQEVRRIRAAHAARFNYDLDAIVRDLKEQERASGRTFVSFPPRRRTPEVPVAMIPLEGAGGSDILDI